MIKTYFTEVAKRPVSESPYIYPRAGGPCLNIMAGGFEHHLEYPGTILHILEGVHLFLKYSGV